MAQEYEAEALSRRGEPSGSPKTSGSRTERPSTARRETQLGGRDARGPPHTRPMSRMTHGGRDARGPPGDAEPNTAGETPAVHRTTPNRTQGTPTRRARRPRSTACRPRATNSHSTPRTTLGGRDARGPPWRRRVRAPRGSFASRQEPREATSARERITRALSPSIDSSSPALAALGGPPRHHWLISSIMSTPLTMSS